MAEFTGHCSRCRATVTATLELGSDDEADVLPAPVIGSYHDCGKDGNPAQAVPLTLTVAV